MTNLKKEVSFTIDHLDPMGQGVAKQNDQVYFIAKTLPSEKGVGIVTKSSKGVNFVELKHISETSEKRVPPPCPHFNECSGCHYLHTNYENEKDFKRISYKKIFQNVLTPDMTIDEIWSEKRLGYRNRIQLHYDFFSRKLGFLKTRSNKILQVPNCKIALDSVKEKLTELYQNQAWQKQIKNAPKRGHVEIYDIDGLVSVNWNDRYAHGGFSQVNGPVNDLMKAYLKNLTDSLEFNSIGDLFGGNGNLSENLLNESRKRIVIDLYQKSMPNDFYSLNLFEETALLQFKNAYKNEIDLLLVDPPRSGFKELNDWAAHLKPKYIVYISCHPQTQARDLKVLQNYTPKKACLIDLFPSTFHFESLIFLERN